MHWLIAHFIGDWFIQSDWLALYKKNSTLRCAIHAMLYLIPFLFTSIPLVLLPIIGLQHFLLDRSYIVEWYVKNIGSGRFDEQPLWPWSIIVIDNLTHIIFIDMLLTAYFGWGAYTMANLGYFAICGYLMAQPFLYNGFKWLQRKFKK